MGEPTCWLIRAGERSRHARRFADQNVVAVGWSNVPGLGDLRGVTPDRVRELLIEARITSPSQDAAELLIFRDVVGVGDIVVTPDAQTREVLIGEVAGEYDYRDPSPAANYKHVHDVRWYGRFDRDLLPGHLAEETKWRRTIRRLRNQDDWRSLAERVRAGEGRRIKERGRPDSPTARRPRHGPGGPPSRRCPACGLTKPLSQFIDPMTPCIDCR